MRRHHWNLIDYWPQVSDACVDYYWRKKPAYAAVQRTFARIPSVEKEVVLA